MDHIDIRKTILKGRLMSNEKVSLFMKTLEILSFSLLFSFVGYVLSLTVEYQNTYEKYITFSLIFFISIIISVLKWNYSMRITKIVTGKSKKENRKIIDNLLEKTKFSLKYENAEFIQATSKNVILWLTMEINFIFKNEEIYININFSDSKATWPSFFRTKKYINEILTISNET